MRKIAILMLVGVLMMMLMTACGKEKKVEAFPYEMNDVITFDLPTDFSGQSNDFVGGVDITEEGKEWTITISPIAYGTEYPADGDSWDAVKAVALNYGDTKELKWGDKEAIRVRMGNMQVTYAQLSDSHYVCVTINTDLEMKKAEAIFDQLEKDARYQRIVSTIKVK